jgi:dihydroxy-acid dehydratase
MPSDRSKLHSQHLRTINFQGDALRMGMNWTEEDLGKPQILVDSAYGMGHPGTFHFRPLIDEISNGVFEAGGKPGVFYVSDVCDGVAQATSGMSYSLVSRDVMAAMVEIHALGHPHDGMVLLSGNDKSVPAHLNAIARCKLPAIHVPGGTQLNAPDYFTSNKLWPFGMEMDRGRKTREELEERQKNACPTCGACQFMGSASTGQVLSEALGLALPGSALIPAPLSMLMRYARAAGKRILELVRLGLTPDKILTRDAFENAIAVHAAIGGSTNALLHLISLAHEAGVELTIDHFDRIHRRVPVLANVKTTGRYPVEYFYYAGGVPKVMLEISDLLHLDCLTVTGKTVGENLEGIRRSYFFEERLGYLRNYHIEPTEIIRPRAEPFGIEGGIAILRGNIAPDGAMIKAFSVPKEMHTHTGPGRVFDGEQACLEALRRSAIKAGDVMVIRYEGPRANGMPEMYFASAVLSADPVLGKRTALITDGRYSGAMQGPSIGHVSPEAADGGPIALVEDGDLIEIDIPARKLGMVGIHGRRAADDEIARVLAERRARWTPRSSRHDGGILRLFSQVATEAAQGGELTPPQRDGRTPAKEAAAPSRGDGNGHRLERRGPPRAPSRDVRGGPVVIADYDFGDVEIERSIIEPAGFELVAKQCKSEGDVMFGEVTPLATAQPPLNLFERESQADVLPWCAAHGVGALTYGALCRGLLTGMIDKATKFEGDDLRNDDPKFRPPRLGQYLEAAWLLERYARARYDKSLLAFAVRWVLDQRGVSIALWGARHPHELDPVDEVMGWKLDAEALAYVDATIAQAVRDPVGSEFMAPPEHAPNEQPAAPL